ncbi:2-dehydro-3-deoxy-6-phosphogalactonate aldolase [Aureimonas jatrophae]|jgi:2-dehydro-3-deoxyphosphogalactonate aldolase|uniref:2-keto-3-deoxy-phosphogalactonate aldolase n=1 Tax=Aureimonas jatrophae TaxID=1166073 RepID=A0A1H0KMI2_9HYPH|nr:2-dehydro-3-deoxy-6-phosphogalactonate aldolase [Aureimonas jatrophae]MBB3948787.1 2-dehydro-3-deoxyphosphogalactonate aldolase [Aureimonas jatrophae]SDO57187.1 2-keto-3-deoxy-phosphogalactonate aldolase [Aureimonas jatrophae]
MTTVRSHAWPHLRRSLVAILRGIRPDEADAAVDTLVDAGFEMIEIPLNSPDAFRSIESAARRAPAHVWIGAGTVLDTGAVDSLAAAGGRLLVSPNVDADVLRRAGEHAMVTMPGVFTPTEAFAALKAGASALKFFPASVLGPAGVNAIRAVLPKDCVVGVVGGVGEDDFEGFAKVGVRTFGLGSSLYKPGMSVAEVRERADRAVSIYDRVYGLG